MGHYGSDYEDSYTSKSAWTLREGCTPSPVILMNASQDKLHIDLPGRKYIKHERLRNEGFAVHQKPNSPRDTIENNAKPNIGITEDLESFGHIRTWEHFGDLSQDDYPLLDSLVSKIGWVVGSDKQGRTLYHYSAEQCKQLLREAGFLCVKIKDCPFCGSKSKVVELQDCGSNNLTYVVQCENCKAETTEFANPDMAVLAWNNRMTEENKLKQNT